MDCQKIQEGILSSFDSTPTAATQRQIDAHLSGCPACRTFAARQKALDARLGTMLVLPAASPGFHTALREQIRRETARSRSDSLPEIVHFGSCAAATLLCILLLPFTPSAVLVAGATAASLTYIPLVALRNLFLEVEEAGQ